MPGTKNQYKFSVVIPCYNSEGTLRQTLDSCLNQTLSPYEIILVDDASSDSTVQIFNDYKIQHNNIKCISFDNNKGVSAARNAGWDNSTGDFVAFLDSDDTFSNIKLEIVNTYIHAFGHQIFWHHYSHSGDKHDTINESELPGVSMTSFGRLLLSSPIATCTIVVPRELSIRFDEEMRYCEDHDFLLRASYKNPLVEIPLALTSIHRRINSPGGLSGQLWNMRKGELYMYHKLHKLNKGLLILQPLFYIYSLLKHVRLLLKK